MDREDLRNYIHSVRRTNIKCFKKDTLLAMLPLIDEEIAENEEQMLSSGKNYDAAVKDTPKGENIPELYEDFIEPYEDSIEFLKNKKGLITNYLAEIEANEKQEEKERVAYGDGTTKSGFYIKEDSPDDLTLFQNGKAILNISLPEMSTQWNTKLP